MNMIQIDMPEKCRYMSDYDRLLKGILPIDRKFILNKTITGCGGTSMFINSSLPVVIISPRIQVLKEKHKQHPDTFLFHIPPVQRQGGSNKRENAGFRRIPDCHRGKFAFRAVIKATQNTRSHWIRRTRYFPYSSRGE